MDVRISVVFLCAVILPPLAQAVPLTLELPKDGQLKQNFNDETSGNLPRRDDSTTDVSKTFETDVSKTFEEVTFKSNDFNLSDLEGSRDRIFNELVEDDVSNEIPRSKLPLKKVWKNDKEFQSPNFLDDQTRNSQVLQEQRTTDLKKELVNEEDNDDPAEDDYPPDVAAEWLDVTTRGPIWLNAAEHEVEDDIQKGENPHDDSEAEASKTGLGGVKDFFVDVGVKVKSFFKETIPHFFKNVFTG